MAYQVVLSLTLCRCLCMTGCLSCQRLALCGHLSGLTVATRTLLDGSSAQKATNLISSLSRSQKSSARVSCTQEISLLLPFPATRIRDMTNLPCCKNLVKPCLRHSYRMPPVDIQSPAPAMVLNVSSLDCDVVKAISFTLSLWKSHWLMSSLLL